MKKIVLFITVVLCANAQYSFGQACCSIFNKSKKIKKPAVYIYFDEKGIPTNTAEQYIPYGSQVNLIATKINPLEQLPEIKTFFKDYYVAPSDIPDISKLIIPQADASSTEATKKMETEKMIVAYSKANQAEFVFNKSIENTKTKKVIGDSSISIAKNIVKSIRQSKC